MTFNAFKTEFSAYCEGAACSGKANSYALAMIYVAEYLRHVQMDGATADDIIAHEDDLTDAHSALYARLLLSLREQGRSTYLRKGFVRAAIPYLRNFRDRL